MIEGLRPYPEIAPTEVGWLSYLPTHWEVMRAKHVFREVDCRSVDGAETHLSMHQKLGLVPSASTGEKRLVSESYAGGKVVEPDDLVLNRLKAHLGVFAYASQQGVISPDYTVLRPLPNAVVRYYEYLLKSPACRGELRIRIKGIVEGFWRLYTDDFYDIRLPVPSLDEQRLIVRFLDWHGAMTGKLIRAKRRLIALLNEQKQSIIHRAVTRGLDPAAKLKPSGVDWLGDVPEHWDVLKLARLVTSTNAGEVIDKGWWGRGDETLFTCARQPLASDFDSFPDWKRTTGEDLLLTRNGTPYIHRPPANAIYSNVVQRINLGPTLNREFVALALEVAAFRMRGYGVSIESLNYDMWKGLIVVRPPLPEQGAIVTEVKEANAGADIAIQQTLAEIALIQEFRTRLIADVVTGQLDVRAVAANLPEGVEDEAADDLTDDAELDDDADDFIDEEEAA